MIEFKDKSVTSGQSFLHEMRHFTGIGTVPQGQFIVANDKTDRVSSIMGYPK